MTAQRRGGGPAAVARRRQVPSPPLPPLHRELSEALRAQARVVSALVLRETRTRFGAAKIGYLWALIEPCSHILVLSLVYLSFARVPPVGTSLALFFCTGLFPFFVYDKTASRLAGAISANRALLHLAQVKYVDVIIARALLELGTVLAVMLVILIVLASIGSLDLTRIEPLTAASAVGALWLIGLGLGTINAVLGALIKTWSNAFRLVTRPLYMLSGIFFMVEKLPPQISSLLLYNPLLHGIEWFRSAFYPGYGRFSLDVGYTLSWGFGTLIVGLTMERLLRKRISATVG